MGNGPKKPRRKIKFSVKETKASTIFGAALGIMSLLTVMIIIQLTFLANGEATLSFAFAGFLATVFSVAGLVLSILCMNDEYQPHTFGWIGLVTNGVALVAMAIILYLGMF